MCHKEKTDYNRNQYGFFTLDQMVSENHFFHRVEKVIDFGFIYEQSKKILS